MWFFFLFIIVEILTLFAAAVGYFSNWKENERQWEKDVYNKVMQNFN